jgi:outer membrane protein W
MTKRVLWMWMAGFLALGATPALAAGNAHGKGAWEITLTSDFDQVFSPSIAYYVIDNLALTVVASYAQEEQDDGTSKVDITDTAFGAGVEYNIPMGGAIVPFVGASLQYFSEDHDESGGTLNDEEFNGTAIEVDAGVKFMVNDRSSVNFLLSYLMGTVEPTIGGSSQDDVDITDMSVGVGYSIYFP